ncbi:MAG: tetratricopeptide repeat protein [Thermoanaerobaculia bacterium]
MVHSVRKLALVSTLALGFAFGAVPAGAQHAPPPAGEPERPDPSSLTAADWRADLEALAAAIERQHPHPFHSISKEAFDEEVRALGERLPDLDLNGTLLELTRLVARLGPGDGHSRVRLERGFIQSQVPLRFYLFEDDPWVIAAHPDHATLAGKRLRSIGGTPAEEALAAIDAVVSGDNAFHRRLNAVLYLSMPEILQALGLATAEGLTLEVEDTATGATTTHQVPFVPWPENVEELFRNAAYDPARLGAPPGWAIMRSAGDATPLYLSRPGDWYWSEEIPTGEPGSSRVLYAQVNVIGNQEGESSLADFYGQLLERAESDDVEKLVIDLRLNGGGNNFLNRALIHGLIRSDTKNVRGRTYILVGRKTFSAAGNLVTKLSHETDVVFVGEPTGASPNHYGDARPVTLPRSGLQVSISTLYWQDGGPMDERPWVPPDIAVDLTAADFAAGRDPVLETVLALDPASVGRPFEAMLTEAFEAGGIEGVLSAYVAYRKDPTHRYVETERFMNRAGYFFLQNGRVDDAIRVFEANVEAYPDSWNVYDSLGEALLEAGRYHEAAENYAKSIELNPANTNGQRMLEQIHAAATAHGQEE